MDRNCILYAVSCLVHASSLIRSPGYCDARRATGRAAPTRKSHPAILMVQSTQDRAADEIPGPLSAARDRGILVQ